MPLNEHHLIWLSRALSGNEAAVQRLNQLYDLVVSTNERINITSLTHPTDVTLKHFLDSLSVLSLEEFSQAIQKKLKVCDVGCGGGFPGLPLACVSPELSLTMVDSTEKKIRALEENVKTLGLSRVVPLWGRGEDLAGVTGKEREKYDVCLSRAVARLPVLCELCLPFVKKGGFFIAMKGARAEEELEESRRAIGALGGKLRRIEALTVSFELFEGTEPNAEDAARIAEFSSAGRYLIVVEKVKNTPREYPRNWAKMTKKPL